MFNDLLMKSKIHFDNEVFLIKKKGLGKYFLNKLKNYSDDERGVGVIELVLILVVLIGFVVIFKDKIKTLLDTVYGKINTQANNLYGD